MTILTPNDKPIIRIFEEDLKSLYVEDPKRDEVPLIMDYHDGNDIAHAKEKMAERYAREVSYVKNTKGELVPNQIKSKPAQVAAIRNNLFEVDTKGMTRKIANNTATLSENSEYIYTDEEFGESLAESRARGQFSIMFSRLDEISVVTGSSVMLLQVNNGDFQYQPITVDKVRIVFGESLDVNGKMVPVDTLKIDHAQCVVIQVDEEKFAAYFGRSDKYPNGRFVQYESKDWDSIPEVGNEGAVDYTVGDDEFASIYNPLTMLQDDYGLYSIPEYPIGIWQGTTQGIGTSLLPVQTGLYEISKEIDLSSSRVAMAANKSARGAWFFTTEGGMLPKQPNPGDEGISELAPGQTVNVLTVPSSNITVANDTIKMMINSLGDSWGVPQYAMTLDANVSVPSGTALMELNRPQVKMQSKRKSINDDQMNRMFEIEKALASIEEGELIGVGVEQNWILRPTDIFKADTELIAEQKELVALGVTDKAHALAELKDITVEEAQAELDALVIVPVANTTGNRLGL